MSQGPAVATIAPLPPHHHGTLQHRHGPEIFWQSWLPGPMPRAALLFVHGVAMNFYLPPLFTLGNELASRGFHSFVINTRGHDWISRAGNLAKFGGAAYENLGDCLPDLDGALEHLQQRNYRRFVLIGHSLGAEVHAQGKRFRSRLNLF